MAVNIKKGSTGAIDFTPMIDMVFNLLLFFMVATEFAKEELELDIPLATASEARPLTATEESVFINIDRDGNYFAANRAMNLEDLEAYLRQKQANQPGSVAVKIRADMRGSLQPYVNALNVCTRVGIRNAALATSADQQ